MSDGKISTQFHLIFKLLCIFSFLAISFDGIAQYDYEHYVPPFYNGSYTDNDIGYHRAILSTNSVKDIVVYIYRGYDDEIAHVTINNTSPYSFPFTRSDGNEKGDIISYPHSYNFPENVVGARELNKVLANDGIRFYSPDGPFFVNIRHSTRDQGLSLTTKGTYAYGTDFLSGHVYTHQNSATNRRSHFISVMATEDNTIVNFTDIKVSRLTEFNSSTNKLQSKLVSPTDVITTETLNKGESYIIGVDHDLAGFSDADKNALNGTSITSNNPIAVNTGSWTSGPSGQDIGVDQIVPVDQVRNEYIILRGKGNSTTERIILVATEDNTEVSVNGAVYDQIDKKGEHIVLIDPYDKNGNVYVTSDKNIYVYQTLSGSSSIIGPTVGMNFIPPVSTSGIREVTVPYAEILAKKSVNGVITILTQTGAVVSYSKDGEEALHPISDIVSLSTKVAGVPQWEIYKLDRNLIGSYRFFSNKAINVAWLVESQYVGAAGYYSGFTKAISKIVPDLDVNADGNLDLICESYEDDIHVSIKEPLPDFYEWYVDDFTKDPIISNGPLVVKAPDKETSYYVVGSYRDPVMDQLYNGSFTEMTIYSDYSFVGNSAQANLQNPGEYCRVQQSIQADPGFSPSFKDMDNDYMMMAISKNRGDTIYKGTAVDVVKGFNYIVKVHGRKVVGNGYSKDQYLKVLVNGDTIVKNFQISDPTKWQSVSALWKPNGAQNGVVKLLNNNATGDYAAFALDSITFVQAVQDTAVFVARVVPNYSYNDHGGAFSFCIENEAVIDVSNSENPEATNWYKYDWYKIEDGNEIELTDGAEYSGTKTHRLQFLNLNVDAYDNAVYRCRIHYAEAYEQCGLTQEPVSFDIVIDVDEAANLSINTDKTIVCEGYPIALQGIVEGNVTSYNWFVQKEGGEEVNVAAGKDYSFATGSSSDHSAGQYTIRCEVVNACGTETASVVVNVKPAPTLNSLSITDNLCEGQEITLTADATGEGTLKYYWKKGTTDLAHSGAVYKFNASSADNGANYSVQAASVYTIGDESIECRSEEAKEILNLDIDPVISFTPLSDINSCVGSQSGFTVDINSPEKFNFIWYKGDIADANILSGEVNSSLNFSPVVLDDAGTYTVKVTNRCDEQFSAADLIVLPKILVNDISVSETGPFCAPTNVTVNFDVANNGAVYIYKVLKPGSAVEEVITNPYTFTATDGTWKFIVEGNCEEAEVSKSFTFNQIPDFGDVTVNDITTCLGETVVFRAEVAGATEHNNLVFKWTKDGLDVHTGQEFTLNNITEANLGEYKCTVTDQCGNTNFDTGSLNVEKVVTSKVPSTITKCVGDPLLIQIDYLGNPTFEWFKDGEATGNTQDKLEISNVQISDAATYKCIVTLACGNKVEIVRNLVVNEHFTLDNSDVPVSICEGEEKQLTIEITGSYNSLQWYDDLGNHIPAFDGKTLVQLPALAYKATPYTYTAKIDGNCENLEKKYIVQVHAKPTLSTIDNTVESCSGPVSLNVTAGGEHNGVSWWNAGKEIFDGNADNTDFVIPLATSDDNGVYTAKASNLYCGEVTESINLNVVNSIDVTSQSPAITTVCEKDNVNLFIVATGENVRYKWYKSGAPESVLSNQATLVLNDISVLEAGDYKCELTNNLNCGDQTLTFNVVVNISPSVSNPQDRIICETQGSVDFTVDGDAQGGANFQWYNNGGMIPGATSATYTETAPVDGQSYYCEVRGVGACGTAISEKAFLTVLNEVAVTDPVDQNIADGANASFSVTASGEPEYSYQWQVNDGSGWSNITNIGKYSGANTATLTITNADKLNFDGNQYRCEVTSSGTICNSDATSNPALLTISSVIKIASQPNGPTVCDGASVDLNIKGYFDALTYTWEYNDGSGYKTAVGAHSMTTALVGKVSTLTIPVVNTDMNSWKFRCLVSDGKSTDEYSNEVSIKVLEDIVVSTVDADLHPCLDDPFSISVTATAGDNIKYKWYKVGNEGAILSVTNTLNIPNIALADEGDYQCVIYNEQGCNDITRTFNVDVLEWATTSDPTDYTMCSTTASHTFEVTAGGDGPFTYQWYNSGGIIAGATERTYTETSPVNGESYYCEVSNSCNTAVSKSARLTVVEPLAVTDPVDQSIADNGTAHFSVTASGEPDYAYQWQVWNGTDWDNISDAHPNYSGTTTSELTVSNARIIDGLSGKKYRCTVTSNGGICNPTISSDEAELTISTSNFITEQPLDESNCEKESVTFTVGTIATVDTYKWYYDDGTGSGFQAAKLTWDLSVPGELTIDPLTLAMDGWKFYCKVSIGAGSPQQTNTVTLNVMEEVAITAPAANDTPEEVCKGVARKLSVSADGSNLSYKWYTKAEPLTILGVGSSLYVDEINADVVYECEVSNGCNSEKRTFTFTVRDELAIGTHPDEATICENNDIPEFSVVAGGYGNTYYQWYNNDGIITGATSDKYTPAVAVNGQAYYCIVSDDCGASLTSNVALLTVKEEVAIKTQPIDIAIVDGDDAEFTIVASGEPTITYQWQEKTGLVWNDITNGGNYSGANSATLTISGADMSFNGKQYRCVVDNDCSNSETSVEVSLTVNNLVKIYAQPQNVRACENDLVEFEITGTSDGLTYDWEYDNGSGTFVNAESVAGMSEVPAANGSKLRINNASLAMNNWKFRCIAKDNSSADEISNVVKVEVLQPVGFTAIDDQPLCFGESRQIELTGVTGTGDLTYLWEKEGTVVSTLPLVNISDSDSDNGNYKVTLSNGVCPDQSDVFTVSHYSALSIDPWANADEVCIGNTETLSATIHVDENLSANFEWFKDEVPLGVTSKDFSLVAANKDQAGQYKLVVKDGCSTKNISSYVNIYQPISRDNNWPASIVLCVGDELNLVTQVSGDINSHVWTKNSTPMTAGSTYLVSSVSDTDAGTYTCTVSGNCGADIIYTIDVTVIDAPSITTGIGDLTVCSGENLKLGPIAISGVYDDISWLAPAGITGTLEDAKKSFNLGNADVSMEGTYKVTVSNKCGDGVSIGNQVVNPIPTLDPLHEQTVCENEDVMFIANATGRNLIYKWTLNDEVIGSNDAVLIIDGAKVLAEDENTPKVYTVKCEVTGDCTVGLNQETSLTVNPNTILNQTLPNEIAYVGDETFTYTLDVVGYNLSYQWTHEPVDGRDKVVLTDQTGPSLVLTDITFEHEGYYNCLITGECGQRLASGRLTIKEPVKVTEGLTDMLTKCVGEPLSLQVTATGMIEKIEWFKTVNGTESKLSETGLSLYIPELALDDAATYKCVIEGEGISQLIESTVVRVYPLTTLVAPLGNLRICEGQPLDWNVEVAGAVDLTYEWVYKGASVNDKKIYHIDALNLNQEGDYSVQVSGLCGDVSTSGNLEIVQLPEFVNASGGLEVCENEPLVEFSVEYKGEDLNYQWRKDGVDLPGKISPVLSLVNVQLDDAGSYTCKVFSTCDQDISPEAILTVTPQLVIDEEPIDVELCAGLEAAFTTSVTGNEVTYQWQKNGVDIAGETSNSYTIAKSLVSDAAYYTCIVSDRCTSSRSTKPAQLSVNALPNSEILGRMVLCAKEDRVTYTTIDKPDIDYGWGVAGGVFAGPEEGLKTRITWQEVANGNLSIVITNVETGCQSRVDSLVTLNALPEVNLNIISSKGVCEEPFALSGGFPEGGIYWVNGVSEENFDPSEEGPGEYEIKYSYTDENGCSNVSTISNLKVDNLPVVDITDDTTIGSCTPFQLSAVTDEDNIKWLPVDNLNDANSMNPLFTPEGSGVTTLSAQVVDEHGCIGVDLVNLNVAPLPIVTTINDITVGQCNQLVLQTDIVGDVDKISWTHPDHLDDATVRSPKIVNAPEGTFTYTISVTDLYGCDATEDVTVNMVEDPQLGEDKFGCEGDEFEVNIAGMQSPVWDDGFTDNLRTITTPGDYTLTVSNEYGCGDEQLFVIHPKLDLGLRDTIIYEGEKVVLRTNLPMEYGPYLYEWQDGSIFSKFEVTETGEYTLSVEDNIGCKAEDSATVTVKPVGIESPTAFTPNSHNENDRFYLKDINYDIQKFELYVYDRWGELLFKSNETGYNGGWDGTYKGKLCPTGAYVWVAFINGELTNKGTFMLVR
eukprot:TRINITY_DN4961_c0_g1_i1.p1 TRINITY_DN4961_c0_g1~~TRINITY_DN4961_c0_g1_i1.p1  ORF type:complete len:4069 (+),score=644.48 TRINITY_DN4961_c0_g1_i1:255-12461(+)